MFAAGANVGTEVENFFQSDRDLHLMAARKYKMQQLAERGKPISLVSKILYFELDETIAYTAQSGFIAQKSGEILGTFEGHKGPVTCIAIADPKHILTSSWDKTIKKWNVDTFECIFTTVAHGDFVKSVKVYGDKFYSGSTDKTIGVWDLASGELLDSWSGHKRSVEDLLITPSGEHLYSCSSDSTVKKWDRLTGEEVASFAGHQTSVYAMFGQFDDECLWSVSGDKFAMRWDLSKGVADVKLEHPDFVKSIAALPNGYIATGCRDENIRIWDPAVKGLFDAAHYGEVSCIQPTGKGGSFMTSGLDNTLRFWNLADVLNQTESVEVDVVKKGPSLSAEEERELAELMDE